MLLSLLAVLLVSYLLVCTIGFVLVRETISDQTLRKLFVLFVILVPPIAAWAVVKACLRRVHVPYNEELARIEDEIEAERVTIFGGKPLSPSFSEAWQLAFLRYLEKAANRVESLFGLRSHSGSVFTHAK